MNRNDDEDYDDVSINYYNKEIFFDTGEFNEHIKLFEYRGWVVFTSMLHNEFKNIFDYCSKNNKQKMIMQPFAWPQ